MIAGAVYLVVINLVAMGLCMADKRRAKQQRWRIPEKILLLSCVAGGAPAFWLTMYRIRHKTRHWYFVLLVPLLALLWVAGVIYVGFLR